MTLKISFRAGAGTRLDSSADPPTVTVAPGGTRVELKAVATEDVDGFEWLDARGSVIASTATSDRRNSTVTFDVVPEGGLVKVRALPSGLVSAPVRIEPPPASADSDARGASAGEYAPVFAAVTFLFVAALIGVVLYVAGRLMASIELPPFGIFTDGQQPNGAWSERATAIVVIGLGAFGAVVVLFGLWLAGLEARARMRRRGRPGDGGASARGGVPASAVTLGAGALMVVAGLWAATGTDSGTPPAAPAPKVVVDGGTPAQP